LLAEFLTPESTQLATGQPIKAMDIGRRVTAAIVYAS
jgi:hypothetical protein